MYCNRTSTFARTMPLNLSKTFSDSKLVPVFSTDLKLSQQSKAPATDLHHSQSPLDLPYRKQIWPQQSHQLWKLSTMNNTSRPFPHLQSAPSQHPQPPNEQLLLHHFIRDNHLNHSMKGLYWERRATRRGYNGGERYSTLMLKVQWWCPGLGKSWLNWSKSHSFFAG